LCFLKTLIEIVFRSSNREKTPKAGKNQEGPVVERLHMDRATPVALLGSSATGVARTIIPFPLVKFGFFVVKKILSKRPD
jgi:hypothetical protein